MSSFVIPQHAMVINLANITLKQASHTPILIGEILKKGTIVLLSSDSQFTVIYLDGSKKLITYDKFTEQINETDLSDEDINLSEDEITNLVGTIQDGTDGKINSLSDHVSKFLILSREESETLARQEFTSQSAQLDDLFNGRNHLPVAPFKTTFNPQISIHNDSLPIKEGKITIRGSVIDVDPNSSINIIISDSALNSELFQGVEVDKSGNFTIDIDINDLTDIMEGPVSLKVNVVAQGNLVTQLSINTKYDSTAPSKPVVTIEQDINNDNILNAQELLDSGKINYRITFDGTNTVAGDSILVNGELTFITNQMISDGYAIIDSIIEPNQGLKLLEIAIVDQYGNRSENAELTSYLIDLKAPGQVAGVFHKPQISVGEAQNGVNIVEAIDGTDIHISLPIGTNIGDKAIVTFQLPNQNETTITTAISESDSAQGFVIVNFNQALLSQINGELSFYATVVDPAGNSSARSDVFQLATDLSIGEPPLIGIDEEILSGLNSQELESDLTLKLTLGENTQPGDILLITINNGVDTTAVEYIVQPNQMAGDEISVPIPNFAFESDGQYDVSAVLRDSSGNSSGGSNELSFVVDTQPPSAPAISIPAINHSGLNGADLVSGLTVEITLPEGTKVGDIISVRLWDSSQNEITTSEYVVKSDDKAGNIITSSINAKYFETETSYSVDALIIDVAGNMGEPSSSVELFVDITAPGEGKGDDGSDIAPTIQLIEVSGSDTHINLNDFNSVLGGNAIPLNISLPPGTVENDYISVALTVPGTSNVISARYLVTQDDINAGFKIVDLSPALLSNDTPNSDYEISAQVIDQLGNKSLSSSKITFSYDITAPEKAELTLVNDNGSQEVEIVNGSLTNDSTPSIQGRFAEPLGTVEIYDENDVRLGTTPIDDNGGWFHIRFYGRGRNH